MYLRIINPIITIFDGLTNEFIGRSSFNLTPEAEADILRLVNYGSMPSSLMLKDFNFYQQSTYFDPPIIGVPASRKGLLTAIFLNDSGELIPMEIRMRYDATARGNLTGSRIFFESTELDNIVVDSIEIITY